MVQNRRKASGEYDRAHHQSHSYNTVIDQNRFELGTYVCLGNPQILRGLLTLSQLGGGGNIIPTTLLLVPPDCQTFLHLCVVFYMCLHLGNPMQSINRRSLN